MVYVDLDGAKAAGGVDGGTQLSVVVNVPLLLHPHAHVNNNNNNMAQGWSKSGVYLEAHKAQLGRKVFGYLFLYKINR